MWCMSVHACIKEQDIFLIARAAIFEIGTPATLEAHPVI